jgi:hypothetical protein
VSPNSFYELLTEMTRATYCRLKRRAVASPIANAPTTKPHEADA